MQLANRGDNDNVEASFALSERIKNEMSIEEPLVHSEPRRKRRKHKKTALNYCLRFVAHVIIAIILSLILYFLQPSTEKFAEVDKCPICYGHSECHLIYSAKMTKNRVLSRLRKFINAIFETNCKTEYSATLWDLKVTLKRLAPASKIRAFDVNLCDSNELAALCTLNKEKHYHKIKRDIDFHKLIERDMNSDKSKLKLCPTMDRLDLLFKNIHLKYRTIDNSSLLANIWTLIKINPEPLILQILPSSQGWPMSKYLGACGRLVMMEYVGPRLSDYYKEAWIRRAKIASSLLRAAYMFTVGHPHFTFYLTEVSADNVAVDANDTAKFVNLRRMIVVDKRITTKNPVPLKWDTIHTAKINDTCKECSSFPSKDVCEHHTSDHNYFVVCQLLLAQDVTKTEITNGLLKDVPKEIVKDYPSLLTLIQECRLPSTDASRINYGDKLKQTLDIVVARHNDAKNNTKT